jgi:hypothetical protein
LESKRNSGTLDRLLTCLSPPDRLVHPLHATPVAFCMLPCLSPAMFASRSFEVAEMTLGDALDLREAEANRVARSLADLESRLSELREHRL